MLIENSKSVFIWGFLFKNQENPIPILVKQLEGKNIQKVSSGGFFFLAVAKNGQLYGWGCTKHARFGVIRMQSLENPQVVPIKIKVSSVAAGNWHSLIIQCETGRVYAAGHNKYGSCGVGNFNNIEKFTPMFLNNIVTEVAAGDGVSLMLTKQQQIYSCGHSSLTGHKSQENLNKPLKINLFNIKYISAGFTHCICLNEAGQLYHWGTFFDYFLKQPVKLKELQGIRIVHGSCSRGEKNPHTMVVDDKGKLYTWGSGYKGKLGHQSKWTHADQADQFRPKQVLNIKTPIRKCSAGGIHSNILSHHGEVFSFGCGSNGRLGHIESTKHRYLYRQGYPRLIETFKGWNIEQLESSYYHNICLGKIRT